jgi:hypothetical protein
MLTPSKVQATRQQNMPEPHEVGVVSRTSGLGIDMRLAPSPTPPQTSSLQFAVLNSHALKASSFESINVHPLP